MATVETTAAVPRALDEAVARIHEVSTLPHVALRVMEVAGDPKSGACEVKEALEADAALSARVLRCVNSSAYAVRTRITNLQHAIAYLGIQQIRNLAMTASVSELFRNDTTVGTYRRVGLWRHLVSVGIGARLIAMRSRFANFEDVFLAGLLHDVGIILEDEHLHEGFCKVIDSHTEGTTLCERERRCLGFDHTELGGAITEAWKFPEGVVATVRHHHDSAECRGAHVDMIRCVEVSNVICSLKVAPSVGVNLVEFPKTAIAGLRLTREDLIVLIEDLEREIESHESLFQM
jgi:HD-like signal output (HDOD) protein